MHEKKRRVSGGHDDTRVSVVSLAKAGVKVSSVC